MAGLAGNWDVSIKAPVGEQRMKPTILVPSAFFAGAFVGYEGNFAIENQRPKGETLIWGMKMRRPLPRTFRLLLIQDRKALNDNVAAPAFGSFPMSVTRS